MTPITIVLTIIILIFYTLFISGLCIAIASFTKTFKEAQSSHIKYDIVIDSKVIFYKE